MQRIIYISSTPEHWLQEDLARLLAVSRRNNAAVGLTGLLLYHDGNFLQVLEGENPALSECFERIARDTRHRQLIVLWRGEAEARAFPQCRMGYARLQDLFCSEPGAVISLHDIAARGLGSAGDPIVERLVGVFLAGFRDLGYGEAVPRTG